jgi:hypothetical protein
LNDVKQRKVKVAEKKRKRKKRKDALEKHIIAKLQNDNYEVITKLNNRG